MLLIIVVIAAPTTTTGAKAKYTKVSHQEGAKDIGNLAEEEAIEMAAVTVSSTDMNDNLNRTKRKELCKWYLNNRCTRGVNCKIFARN